MPKREGLTPKQEMFCLEYLKDFNATQAALRAGYGKTPKAAATHGYRLLQEMLISQKIRSLAGRIKKKVEIEATDALRWARDIASSNIFEVVDVSEKSGNVTLKARKEILPGHQRAVLEIMQSAGEGGESIKVRMHNKVEAIKLIFQYLRLVGDDRNPDDDQDGIDDALHGRVMGAIERIKKRREQKGV